MTAIRSLIAAALVALALAFAAPASAGDPQIEAAKDGGIVGERIDGFLGFVRETNDAALKRKVLETNNARRRLFDKLAADTGTTVEAVGIVTGEKQIAKAEPGEYYMDDTGAWKRK